LHTTYFYYGRLDANGVSNNPERFSAYLGDSDVNNDGFSDDRDVPARRKMFVRKEPDSRRVLMADAVSLWAGGGGPGPTGQWRVNHGPDYGFATRGGVVQAPGLIDQNVSYGDGHVILKKATQFPAPLINGESHSKLRVTANMARGQDLHWW
jgi:hypothetical protein